MKHASLPSPHPQCQRRGAPNPNPNPHLPAEDAAHAGRQAARRRRQRQRRRQRAAGAVRRGQRRRRRGGHQPAARRRHRPVPCTRSHTHATHDSVSPPAANAGGARALQELPRSCRSQRRAPGVSMVPFFRSGRWVGDSPGNSVLSSHRRMEDMRPPVEGPLLGSFSCAINHKVPRWFPFQFRTLSFTFPGSVCELKRQKGARTSLPLAEPDVCSGGGRCAAAAAPAAAPEACWPDCITLRPCAGRGAHACGKATPASARQRLMLTTAPAPDTPDTQTQRAAPFSYLCPCFPPTPIHPSSR